MDEEQNTDVVEERPDEVEESQPVVVDSTAQNQKRLLKGRVKITTSYEEITEENVVEVLNDTLTAFAVNSNDIAYLWNYYKGVQPILDRTKDVRPEINNKIVENHAQEIVSFKVGYQLAEPLQYTCRKSDDKNYDKRLKDVDELNTLMFAEDKASCDRDLFEWMCVGGVGYRMTEADKAEDVEDGGAPYELYTLDPRNTYVVYSSAYHGKQLMSVWVAKDPKTGKEVYNVFTDDHYYFIEGGVINEEKSHAHTYGHNPITEYPLNNARMGVFEPALPLLDAINAIESNRLDGIEQTVQALMKFVNVDITEDDFVKMLKLGAVKVTSRDGIKGDVDVIKNDLDQSQTQVTKDDLYQAVVNICGMPNRSTSTGSVDTGAAVLLRDGWTLAESHAKSYELQIKRAERNMLRVVLKICADTTDCNIDLRIRDIELAFNRRNYENILVKAQVLTTMLKSSQIHPQLAFKACGLFTDPEAAYLLSKEYIEEQRPKSSVATSAKRADGGIDDGDPDDAGVSSQVGIGSQAMVPEPKQ